ncbi:hypothetical protein [Patulibacter minatonensis]|uniref:hypothetical protein n=1 Tax=Patulibacter minatonensis TaxID=298163 RepID=UPI0004B1A81A|nr:hypothetical protein [Patulibacter minatonensis]
MEDPDDLDAADKVNALHAPTCGVIVTHVQAAGGTGPLADDILWALGRPANVDTPSTKLQAWSAAWLSTARPHCQLIVYGAARLTTAGIRWLTELATNTVNVWLVAPLGQNAPLDMVPGHSWSWATFLTRPWHDTVPSPAGDDLLLGHDPTGEWGTPILPPYPLARTTIANTPTRTQTYRSILDLHGTYEALWPVIQSMLGRPPYERRHVLAAVARIALISDSAADLSILLRAFEEDVFMADGLLVTSPKTIAATMRTLKRDALEGPVADGTLYDQEADPQQAVLDIYARMRASWAPAARERGPIELADDGTQFIPSSGELIDIPPWLQWHARAALAIRGPQRSRIARARRRTATGQPPDRSAFEMVSATNAGRPAHLEYADLAPVIDAIRPAAAYIQLATAESEMPVEIEERRRLRAICTSDSMPLSAALHARRLRDEHSRATPYDRPNGKAPESEGLRWLLEHDLAVWDEHRRRYLLVGWFEEHLKARTGVYVGPRLQTRWF